MDHGCYTLLLSFHQSVGGFTACQESSGPKERLLGHGLAGISRREA